MWVTSYIWLWRSFILYLFSAWLYIWNLDHECNIMAIITFCIISLLQVVIKLFCFMSVLQKVDIEEISSSDYFKKNNEFSTWLKEEKGVFFSDLSADSAREKFLKFVEKWNKGKLPSQYYEGISTGPRTSHNWKIKM